MHFLSATGLSAVEREFVNPMESASIEQIFSVQAMQLDVDLLVAQLAFNDHRVLRGERIT